MRFYHGTRHYSGQQQSINKYNESEESVGGVGGFRDSDDYLSIECGQAAKDGRRA